MQASLDRRSSPLVGVPISPATTVGVAAVVVARWLALGSPSLRAAVGASVVVLTVGVLVAVCQHRGRPVAAAAVVLACSPTVLVATADGRWQGGVAVLVIALAVWSDRPAVAASLGALGAIALVAWWRSGFDRGDAPGPSWHDILNGTGDVVRRALASVGLEEMPIPLTAALLYALGIGLVIGAALVAGRPGRTLLVPAALLVLVLGIWAIRLWRGAVDPLGGTWLLSAAVVLVAVTGEPPGEAGRRITTGIALVGTMVWLAALWSEVGADAVAAIVLSTFGTGLVAVSLIAPDAGGRLARVLAR